jgi:hypothetical protein
MNIPFPLLACLLSLLMVPSGTIFAQQYEWARQFGGSSVDYVYSVTVDGDNDVIVLGHTDGPIDLDPGTGTNMVPNGQDFIVKLDSNGLFLWGGGFARHSPSAQMTPREILNDAAGNLYIVGQMQGTLDFDIGAGIDTVGIPINHLGTYFVRYSASGQYLGAKIVENMASEFEPSAVMAIDDQANLYFVGEFSDTVDVDMGPGVQQLVCNSISDACLIKYDSSLAFQWVVPLSGTFGDRGFSVAVAPDRVYLTASLKGQVDVDPGPGTTLLSSISGFEDPYLVAYRQDGSFLWADHWNGTSVNSGFYISVKANAAGHVVLSLRYEGSLDLDPGTDVQMSTIAGGPDIVVIRVDTNGAYLWGRRIGCSTRDEVQGTQLGPSGMIYLLTNFSGNIDVDPGLGQTLLGVSAIGVVDAAVLKFDPAGNFIWAAEVDGPGYDWAYGLALDQDESIYFVGTLDLTADYDPSPSGTAFMTEVGNSDGFLAKWSQTACRNLSLVIDSVAHGDCQNPNAYLAGTAYGGAAPYAYQWNTNPVTLDSVATTSTSGIHRLTVLDANGCQQQREVLSAAPTLLNGFDLSAFLVANNFRPGNLTTVTIDAFNRGCSPVSGQVKLALDPLATYQTALPLPSQVTADTLYWNTPSMNYDSAHFIVQVTLLTDTFAQGTDTIHLGLAVTPTLGDQNPQDNSRSDYVFPVVNSYDPNIKQVYPPGQCEALYVRKNAPLTYTVQFQNTGTAEALEVAIQDTLDPSLDLTTLKIMASSHPMVTEVLPGNILLFQFHDIHLPDSTANEAGSHGYVIYEIWPNAAVSSGTQVSNSADIYFDYNPAVQTIHA